MEGEELKEFLELERGDLKYLDASSVRDACLMLETYGKKARIIAGGTRILTLIRQGNVQPEYLVNIRNIPNLDYVVGYEESGERGIKIGTLTTLFNLSQSRIVNENLPVLAEAIRTRTARINRTRWAYYMATLGGLLFTTEEAGEVLPALIIMGSRAVLHNHQGWEVVPIEIIYEEDVTRKMLTEVRVPSVSRPSAGFAYGKRIDAGGNFIFSAGVYVQLDAKHTVFEDVGLVVGYVKRPYVRSFAATELLKGNPIDEFLIMDAAQRAAEELTDYFPDEDKRTLEELVEATVKHAVDMAIGDFALGY